MSAFRGIADIAIEAPKSASDPFRQRAALDCRNANESCSYSSDRNFMIRWGNAAKLARERRSRSACIWSIFSAVGYFGMSRCCSSHQPIFWRQG